MKKILAVLLTILMMFSLAAPAFAAEAELDDAQTSTEVVESDSTVGDDVLDVYEDIKNEDYQAAFTGAVGAIRKFIEAVHELLHDFVKLFKFACPFCGKVIVEANPENIADVLADAKSGDTVILVAGDYEVITLGALDGVEIEATEGVVVDKIVTTAESVLKDVIIKGFELEVESGKSRDHGIKIDANAVIENLVIEDVTFTGPATYKNCEGINGNNVNATITVKNCTFNGVGYALYTSGKGGFAALTFDGCTFNEIYSWVVHAQYGFNGDLTINGCTFTACEDGISKNGSFAADKTFTFTNNTVGADCAGHDGKDSKWFELKTASAVIEGNTLAGAEWIPGADQGIKAL